MEEKKISSMGLPGMLGSVNPQDAELVIKTGFGHGCDITVNWARIIASPQFWTMNC